MIGRRALRSLTARPVRSAVLAAGFGFGVGVMAILLGVAAIVLEQAQSPQLVGGGDVLVRLGPQVPAKLLLAGALQADALRDRIDAASPFARADLVLEQEGHRTHVSARGGIPSLEGAVGDAEVAQVPAWRDSAADRSWTLQGPARVLREIDRFHAIPDAPEWQESWAEWLYFNGRTGDARFYLTFLVGPRVTSDRRAAGVRLQLDRGGRMETFSASADVPDADVAAAPDLAIGRSRVTLDGLVYRIHLDLRDARGRRATGDLALEASPGRWVPPIEVSGARGWVTGYVVPVMSGPLTGSLDVDGTRVPVAGTGYHDHNWGFWRGVSWQWGQVQHGDLSLVYGRVFPPPDAADPERLPGFVGVLGPDGPLGYGTDVQIDETSDAAGRPAHIAIRARGASLDLRTAIDVERITTNRSTQGPLAGGVDFLQLRGRYTVAGRVGSRTLDFSAVGAAETFRGQSSPR